MSASILFKKSSAVIDSLELDASVSEAHEYKNEVSEFPSEDGSTIVDNIRLLPDRVTINGVVSNTPVSGVFDKVFDIVTGTSNVKEAFNFKRDDTGTRVESARDILLRIRGSVVGGQNKDPKIIDIVTGLRKYTDMVMDSLVFDRDARTGQALFFSAVFVNVKTADVEVTGVAKPEPDEEVVDKASAKTQKGKQKTETASDATETETSIIKTAVNWLRGK